MIIRPQKVRTEGPLMTWDVRRGRNLALANQLTVKYKHNRYDHFYLNKKQIIPTRFSKNKQNTSNV